MNFLRAATSAHSGAGANDASQEALTRWVDRLREIIESETRILKQGGHVDFDALKQHDVRTIISLETCLWHTAPERRKAGQNGIAFRNAPIFASPVLATIS